MKLQILSIFLFLNSICLQSFAKDFAEMRPKDLYQECQSAKLEVDKLEGELTVLQWDLDPAKVIGGATFGTGALFAILGSTLRYKQSLGQLDIGGHMRDYCGALMQTLGGGMAIGGGLVYGIRYYQLKGGQKEKAIEGKRKELEAARDYSKRCQERLEKVLDAAGNQ